MSRLLEILGRAIEIDTADLIWQWLDTVEPPDVDSQQYQQLNKVISLFGDRKTDAAQQQLRLYLFENPSCTIGRMAAAAISLRNNQLQNAIEELNSVYMRQPNNTVALYALGCCYERLGKEAQAVEFYQDCLKFKSYLKPPRQRLAAIYFKNGQLENAIAEYELLRHEYPDDISALVTLGHLYIANASYIRAIEAFNAAILMHPDNFQLDDDPIEQLLTAGQPYDALEQIENMLQNQPERVDLLLKRADILAALGATADAIEQYQQAIHICPGFLEATIKLGTQLLQSGDEQLAARQFNNAVEINDQIVDAYIGLAIAQKSAGDGIGALTTLSLAAAIQPNSYVLFVEAAALQFKLSLGSSLFCRCEDDPAKIIAPLIAAHQRQISQRPQNPDLHYRLGVLMMSLGRLSEAVTEFQTALDINPTFTRAASKLALCFFETDRKTEALRQLTAPEPLDKDTLELHYKVALLYCDSVRFASSLINLEHLLENNFTSADTTINISVVLQNLGLLDRAAAMWDNLADTAAQAVNDWPSQR